jgi:hypothetical protein
MAESAGEGDCLSDFVVNKVDLRVLACAVKGDLQTF